MKVLTLTQPWASLVALGAKTIEEPFATALGNLRPAQLPTASIICVTSILECRKFTEGTLEQVRRWSEGEGRPKFEADFGDYSAGRYGFRLGPVVMLKTPVIARGMLNLWNAPADVERAVREQLAETA